MEVRPAPKPATRFRLIGGTALITFILTFPISWVVLLVVGNQGQPTPQLGAPKKITITLHPLPEWGLQGSLPTDIPKSEFDHVMRLVTPVGYLRGGVNELVYPIVAQVEMVHENGKDTHMLVRSCGKNPAIVTVDGKAYFWATPDEEYSDGSMALVSLVRRIDKARKP
jgi:hypothetical protein